MVGGFHFVANGCGVQHMLDIHTAYQAAIQPPIVNATRTRHCPGMKRDAHPIKQRWCIVTKRCGVGTELVHSRLYLLCGSCILCNSFYQTVPICKIDVQEVI